MGLEPITPEEAKERRGSNIPPFVINIVNKLIEEKFNGKTATFTQEDVVTHLLALPRAPKRHEIFDKGWLDFEPLFRKAGWKVEFDKPGYNEDYVGFWVFTKKKKKVRD